MKKAALHNLGCKVNAYETEVMTQQLKEAGYEIVAFTEVADVYVVNTCTVTNIADRKSRQMLHQAKKRNPNATVVATGCYVQMAGEEVLKDTGVDLVIGNNRKKDLVNILDQYFNNPDHQVLDNYIDINHINEFEEMELHTITDHTRAYIKIQDGCNQFCSYCAIPFARGRVRSRNLDSIVNEIKKMADLGYKEVVLTGIHISSYGTDFKDQKIGLLDVILAVHRIQGIERIRLSSIEPRVITDEFARAIGGLPKVCPHFHLSLQSGCDETLKRMNRRYDTREFLAITRRLRENFENPSLCTDIIVGFPGETEEEFETTRAFLDQVHFAEMHVFKYSVRGGTRAAKMPNQVPSELKNSRSDCLLDLENKMRHEYYESFYGKTRKVLFEEAMRLKGTDYYVGHTREYLYVAVASKEDLSGQILPCKILNAINHDFVAGELL